MNKIERLLPSSTRLTDVGDLNVRLGEARDLPRLNEIYSYFVVETPITFDLEPYTMDERIEWFAHFAPTGRHRLVVAESEGLVLGYACTRQFRVKRAYDTTVEMTVTCAPEAVGFGIGVRLYEYLFPEIAGEDIHSAIAAITLPNDASCALHERFGFTHVATLREIGRKFDRYWDVAWYQRRFE
jgi:phosphinothricin acetyltransferase